MPELPEIETIKRSLEDKLQKKAIRDIEILLPRQIKYPEPEEFIKRIQGKEIESLGRIGKYLLLNLANGVSIIFHLRMTGQLIYSTTKEHKHLRMALSLSDGNYLLFCDTRTFGTVNAVFKEEYHQLKGMVEMGPEPLSTAFTPEYLKNMIKGRKTTIKGFLLDQTKIGGLGNIYVDEALFLAGIYPKRQACTIEAEEADRLFNAINRVIAAGIEDGGTTFRDYRDGNGQRGSHQEKLFVYGRQGEPCKTCQALLEKMTVGGRGTTYCPQCQK